MKKFKYKKNEKRSSTERKKNVAERKGIGNNERVHAHSLTRLVVCSPAPLSYSFVRLLLNCGRKINVCVCLCVNAYASECTTLSGSEVLAARYTA